MAIKSLSPAKPRMASGVLKEVFDEIGEVFPGGEIPPPFLLHSFHPEFLSAFWNFGKTVYFSGGCSRAEKDAIASGVSFANRCTYCLDAHAELLRFSDSRAATRALSGDSELPESRLEKLIAWGKATGASSSIRGMQLPVDSEFREEAIATALNFHYVNRLVNVFLGPSPFPLRWFPGVKRLFLTMGHSMLRDLAFKTLDESKVKLNPYSSANSVSWAKGNERIAQAFSALKRAAESVGDVALSGTTRDRIASRLEAWEGEVLPLSEGGVDETISSLPGDQRPLARIALMTALAPLRITKAHFASCQTLGNSDKEISGAAIWGGFVAAERIGNWL